MPREALLCLLWLVWQNISQLHFQKYFLHAYSKNDLNIFGALFTRKKNFSGKHFMFAQLEEDLVEFKFVIFKAFGIEYSNQTRFYFIQLQRHFCY